MTKTTKLEKAMIYAVVNNEFADGDEFSGTYAWVVCGDRSGAAVLGSLVKKGLVFTSYYEEMKLEEVTLTDTGREVYKGL